MASEAPDNTGGSAIVVLGVAGVTRAHIVTLYAPGEIFDEELIVCPAANVDHQRTPDKSAGIETSNACPNLEERAPPSDIGEKTGTGHRLVLSHALAIKATAIDEDPELLKTRERQQFK